MLLHTPAWLWKSDSPVTCPSWVCCENKITYGVNYHKESKKRELAVNSFLNITDAVKGQLCFNGHLYKLDPIYIPSLISTDSLQDGRRLSSFQKKIWKVTNYKRGWNVHFSISSTGCKLHVACTFLSNSYLLTKACTFSALTDNLLWQLEGDNRPDVTAVRDSTTEKERKIK